MIWEGELILKDALVDLVVVQAIIRRNAKNKLVKKCSQAVIVEGKTVTFSNQHFRSHVFRASAK